MSVPSLHHSSCIIYLWDSRLHTPCRLLRFPLHSLSLHFYLQKVSLFQQVLLTVISARTSFSPFTFVYLILTVLPPMVLFSTSIPRFAHFLVDDLTVRLSLRRISQSSAEVENISWPLGSWGWTRQGQRRCRSGLLAML